jgi:hypothetical protein
MTAITATVKTKKTSKELWRIHRAAADTAKAMDADFWCAQRVGFAAVMSETTGMVVRLKLCATCSKRGVGQ